MARVRVRVRVGVRVRVNVELGLGLSYFLSCYEATQNLWLTAFGY